MYGGAGYLLRTSSGAEPVQGERVSGGFFKTLGVQPMLGRDFYPGEDRPGAEYRALELWSVAAIASAQGATRWDRR